MEDPHLIAARIMWQNRYLSLGTSGADGPWVAPVAFTTGPDFCFLFYSAMDALHSENIIHNPKVAGAIFDSTTASSTADGVQFSGIASIVTPDELPDMMDRYFRLSFRDKAEREAWLRPAEDFMDNSPQRFYKIVLKSVFKLDLEHTKTDRRLSLDIDELKNALWDLEMADDAKSERLDKLFEQAYMEIDTKNEKR